MVVESSLPLYHSTFSILELECGALLFLSALTALSDQSQEEVVGLPTSQPQLQQQLGMLGMFCTLSILFQFSVHLILWTGKVFGRTFLGTFADSCGQCFDQAIYQRFAPNGVVYDACAGWGGRLLGAPLGDDCLSYKLTTGFESLLAQTDTLNIFDFP